MRGNMNRRFLIYSGGAFSAGSSLQFFDEKLFEYLFSNHESDFDVRVIAKLTRAFNRSRTVFAARLDGTQSSLIESDLNCLLQKAAYLNIQPFLFDFIRGRLKN